MKSTMECNPLRTIINTLEKSGMICFLAVGFLGCTRNEQTKNQEFYREPYRPQFHFSPPEHWMNDPNGMVYYDGEYHLFYQYYPGDIVWGPMHWGHAVSTDLVHWSHLPVALYPDSLGMIFSGSAVVDHENSSGFGSAAKPPLVAIYTRHDATGDQQGKDDFETQCIAYSLDAGRSWTKYQGNPVIKNPGIRDFRDPKVFWHDASQKWILILAARDHVELYASKDLRTWHKLSEFGEAFGAHGGVWECPDLIPLAVDGDQEHKWVMIVNINPGAPNGGSGTQYFIGDFDGEKFTCDSPAEKTSWIDYGPDDYAGVTWSGTPDSRTIFLGWMSNWAYAGVVPTAPWRSANTVPRELKLTRVNNSLVVRSVIVPELQTLIKSKKVFPSMEVIDSMNLTPQLDFPVSKTIIEGVIEAKDFYVEFSNAIGQKLSIGFDAPKNRYFLDRSHAGKNDFSKDFNSLAYAPRLVSGNTIAFTMVVDVSSVEVFFDDGTTVMTAIFFPDQEFNRLAILGKSGKIHVDSLVVKEVLSIW